MQNESGWTPLMYAAQKGLDSVCERLIKSNSNIQLVNNRGRTALILAASWGHCNTVGVSCNYLLNNKKNNLTY